MNMRDGVHVEDGVPRVVSEESLRSRNLIPSSASCHDYCAFVTYIVAVSVS